MSVKTTFACLVLSAIVIAPSLSLRAFAADSSAPMIQTNWEPLSNIATRFPYYVDEPNPASSRACNDDWGKYGNDGTVYFVAVSDASYSRVLWPSEIGRCACPEGTEKCEPGCSSTIQERQCGRKILLKCVDDACQPEYRNKSMVVMIRDVCPAGHWRNVKSGHCQPGNSIDIFAKLYQILTNRGDDGPNLRVEFGELADQNTPLGPIEYVSRTRFCQAGESGDGLGWGSIYQCDNQMCAKSDASFASECIIEGSSAEKKSDPFSGCENLHIQAYYSSRWNTYYWWYKYGSLTDAFGNKMDPNGPKTDVYGNKMDQNFLPITSGAPFPSEATLVTRRVHAPGIVSFKATSMSDYRVLTVKDQRIGLAPFDSGQSDQFEIINLGDRRFLMKSLANNQYLSGAPGRELAVNADLPTGNSVYRFFCSRD